MMQCISFCYWHCFAYICEICVLYDGYGWLFQIEQLCIFVMIGNGWLLEMLILSLNWRSLEGVWVIWLPVRVILLWESCIHSHVVPIIGCDPWCVMSINGWSYSDVSTILLKEILSNGRPIPWGKVISRSCALACRLDLGICVFMVKWFFNDIYIYVFYNWFLLVLSLIILCTFNMYYMSMCSMFSNVLELILISLAKLIGAASCWNSDFCRAW